MQSSDSPPAPPAVAAAATSADPRSGAVGDGPPAAFVFADQAVAPGSRATIDLPVSVTTNHMPVTVPVQVLHGARPGPVLFVSAAVHGDEVIGTEIVRRLLQRPLLEDLAGTLMAVPIVNAYGFMVRSRYLPDRRDLNRSFPGQAGGSMAAQIAHRFFDHVLGRAQFGIDLHSAAIHRENLPQIRISPSRPETWALAEAFGAPLILTSDLREGSLRAAARGRGLDVMVFEGGEGLRFSESAIAAALYGILRVMRALDMLGPQARALQGVPPAQLPLRADSSHWVRAPSGGILDARVAIGERVDRGQIVGVLRDPFGAREVQVTTRAEGLVVGTTRLPVVNQGEALFHVAHTYAVDSQTPPEVMEPLLDEDEIL